MDPHCITQHLHHIGLHDLCFAVGPVLSRMQSRVLHYMLLYTLSKSEVYTAC